jgi:hypothetical protein
MSALATFRRAMRRHEKRARAQRHHELSAALRWMGAHHDAALDNEAHFRRTARENRWGGYRQWAWLYERAAAAVARLRAGGGA